MRKIIILLLILPAALTACLVPPMQSATDPAPTDGQDREVEAPAPQSATDPAPASDQDRSVVRSDLPDLGPAPEIANTVWINSDRPLRLAELEGKVVLIDMWTFG